MKDARDPTKKDATRSRKVANIKKDTISQKSKQPQNRSGNPQPENQFAKRNSTAQKHGFFSKFLLEETLEIMGSMNELSASDLIWQQIQIQYAAIIRAQKIMFVQNQEHTTEHLKRVKDSDSGWEKEGVTPASVIADIDTTIAEGGTIDFTNHLIADTPPADPYGMYYSSANFIQILDYLYSQKDEIEVITLD